MTREDIIRMAREAGFSSHHNPDLYDCMVASDKAIERFAAFVAEHTLANIDPSKFMSYQEGLEAGRFAEREACAKVAEAYEPCCDTCPSGVANAIRSRGIV
jgi:hypothetical protein